MSENESLYEDMMGRNEVGAEGDKTMLTFNFNFQDESVKNFTVTNICWSRINAESLLATYVSSDITEKHPSKILIWSLKNKLKPQHIINCEKKITRAIFHPTSDNIVYAATYSGNIYQFATGTSTQQQKSSNVGDKDEYHATPIFALEYFIRDNKEYLVSVSVDGKMCIWDMNFLMQPIINKLLEYPPIKDSPKLKSIQALSSFMLHPASEEATLVLGTHDRFVILYKLSSFFANAEEIVSNAVATRHTAPICSVSGKYDATHAFLQDLYLTGSFDFDIQLWRINEFTSTILKTFTIHTDYVVTVEWNPVHPALFASCDCNGRFLIFDLIANSNYFTYEGNSLPCSTMRWSPDGLKLAFGALTGEVQIWNMRKKYIRHNEEKLNAIRKDL